MGDIKGKHRNFAQDHRPRPLRSGTESAPSELPTDPIFIASGVWEREKTGGLIRTKGGERAKAEERIKASTANAKAKLKQKQTNILEAYPNSFPPPSALRKFRGHRMNPKDAAEAKEKLNVGEQREAVLITRNKNGSHITARYLDATSSSMEGGWGYRTMHARSFHALTTVEEILESTPRGDSRGQNTSVFRGYSPGASSERVLQPYFDEDDEKWAEDGSKVAASSSSGVEFQPFTEYKRGLKRSAKEIDEEHGFSLTAMSPKKEEESSSSEPSSVMSKGSDSEESNRYSPTSPRQNRNHRFFGSPTEGASMAPACGERRIIIFPKKRVSVATQDFCKG